MIELYTDGSSWQGVGGWAWLLVADGRFVTGDVGRIPADTTNQRMELVAAGAGLAWLPADVDVTVVSDSAYLVNCFLQQWYVKWRSGDWRTSAKKPVENRDIWERLLAVVERRTGATLWRHVKGHNGDHFNEICDELAGRARTHQPKEKVA